MCLSVRPSVCQSVKRVDCDERKGKCVQIFIQYEKSFSLVFLEEWFVGATLSTWNFGSTGLRWSEIADFEPIIAHSASAVTYSEKSSINTNRNSKSTMPFPMSLRWSSYVAPTSPKGGSRMQNDRFSSKIALRLKKLVCYKVSLCENCQRQSCKAFVGLTVQKRLVGATTFTWNFGSKWPRRSEIADFRSIFAYSA